MDETGLAMFILGFIVGGFGGMYVGSWLAQLSMRGRM